MTLSDYLIMVTISQYSSITMTADALYLTKSAVSHSLAKIEKELGLPLFNRSTKSVSLTTYGEQLLPFATAVLNEDRKFRDQIHSLQGLESGIVRIGTNSSICSNWIPGILNSFRKEFPNIELQVRSGACNQEIIEWLIRNEVDIGIGCSDANPAIDIEEVYQDEMICITDPYFRPKNTNYVVAEDVKKTPLLIQEYPYNEEVLKVLSNLNMTSDTCFTGYDDTTLIAMVESGMGYCIQGKLVMKRITAAVQVFSFEPKQYRNIAILLKHGIQQAAATKEMCRYIRNYAKNFPTAYELDLLFVPER